MHLNTGWAALAAVLSMPVFVGRAEAQVPTSTVLEQAIAAYQQRDYLGAENLLATLSSPEAKAYFMAARFRRGDRRAETLLPPADEARAAIPSFCCPVPLPGSPAAEVASLVIGFSNDAHKRWQQQVDELTALLSHQPGVGYAYYYRGLAYYFLHRVDGFISDLETFLRFEPNSPEAPLVRQLLAGLGYSPPCPSAPQFCHAIFPAPSRCPDGQMLCRRQEPRCDSSTPPICVDVTVGYDCRAACDDPLDGVPFDEAGVPGSCGWSNWFAATQKTACDDWCGESCVKRQACGIALCEPWPNYCWQCPNLPPPDTGPVDPAATCAYHGWFESDAKDGCDVQCGHSCERKQVCGGQLCQPWPHYCWRCGPPPAANTCEAQGWYEHDERELCEFESGRTCGRKQICGGEPCEPWPHYCWKPL